MKVYIAFWDRDPHGTECACGLCNSTTGISYGCAIFSEGSDEPLHVEYAASEWSAERNCRLECEKQGWQIVSWGEA